MVLEGNKLISSYIYVKPYICLVLVSFLVSRILLIRHCFMCVFYCCGGRKVDNLMG